MRVVLEFFRGPRDGQVLDGDPDAASIDEASALDRLFVNDIGEDRIRVTSDYADSPWSGRIVPRHDDARLAAGRLTCFGGRREADETPEDCLRRELREELNWEPKNLVRTLLLIGECGRVLFASRVVQFGLWVVGMIVAWVSRFIPW
jgi:hypothetical protein